VLGSPIAHSLSPVLHAAAYRSLGLDHWSYDAHDVAAAGLPGFVEALDDCWVGLSLTMPLKEVALDVADEVSGLARDLGVANTLVRRSGRGWGADNTDVYGVSRALVEAGWPSASAPSAAPAVVIGSGATARSVLAALTDLGGSDVVLVVREQPRPPALALADRLGLGVHVRREAEAHDLVATAPLVVNTAPAGGADGLAAQLGDATPPPGQVLLDVVYDGWPTPLAKAFASRGASVAGGLDLLVHQAARQVLLMTGLEPPVEAMRSAGLAALAGR
jgi:shikimate dehydrogenase